MIHAKVVIASIVSFLSLNKSSGSIKRPNGLELYTLPR
jgi:hypothetical protein